MSRWEATAIRYDALQPRERLLIAATAGVFLVALLYVMWIEPAGKAAQRDREAAETLLPQVDGLEQALARLDAELARDPEAERRVTLAQLQADAGAIDERLRAGEGEVIPPARMPAVLAELIGDERRLRVIGVRSLPPEVLRFAPVAAVPAEGREPAQAGPLAQAGPPDASIIPALYRHRVALGFEGDFAAALDYVHAIEALPYRVRLREFEIDAATWPRLRITLEVETLGVEEGWIGV